MIKKIITYFLSLLMIFAPAYSAYASVLPSKGQIIAIGKKGGAMIKTSGGRIVKGGAIGIGIEGARIGIGAAMSWCKNNQKKCKDKIGDIAELACDDFECIAEKEDEEQTSECIDKEYYIRYNKGQMIYGADPDTVCQSYFNTLSYNKSIYTAYVNDSGTMCLIKGDGTPIGQLKFNGATLSVIHKNTECTDKPKKRPLTDDELNDLAKKIGESMDDDDIINYYNTDYGDIIINDKRYGGDDINYETNIDNRCNNNSCHEISQEIEQDVRSKKYDIDDVTPENCTMSNNKYISCKKPDSDSNDDTNDDTKQDEQDKQDEQLTCDSSKFHKKVCDWIDWTQDDLDEQDDGKAEIKDLSKDLELDDDKINFGRACPSGPIVNISFAGVVVLHDISYEGLCDAFTTMRPFVIGIGGIVSVMIIGGRRA